MESEVFLHSFRPIYPQHHKSQDDLVKWTLESHQRCADLLGQQKLQLEKMQRYCLASDQIEQRYYECDDVNLDWKEHDIYRISQDEPFGADILKRNEFFCQRATDIFKEIYTDEIKPNHLIHVTCTGYVSPSPPQLFFAGTSSPPEITHAYHMGCYASLPSVRMATAIVRGLNEEKVDLVHTEMCSLHMNPSLHYPEQIVVQTLFADGHIKYTAGSNPLGPSFEVLRVKEELVPDSEEDMTWIPAPFGMKMSLSKEVPAKIGEALEGFVLGLCAEAKVSFEDVRKNGLFAIHPGGPRIITSVQQKLNLRDEQVMASLKVLRERGNMSSATLPHVWHEILQGPLHDGQLVLSLAFGPGLTIFGSIFRVRL
jgi:predicted naringenin-chalcone synthase